MAMIIVVSVTQGGSDAPLALPLNDWETMAKILGLAGFIIGVITFVKRIVRK